MRYLIFVAAAFLGACASAPAPLSVVAAPDSIGVFGARYPLSMAQRATTDATIYLGNLDAKIAVLEAELARTPTANTRATLAGALLTRFRIVGRLDDGERALTLSGEAALDAADQPDVHRVHASALSAFHLFADAERALAQAQAAGASAPSLAPVRRDLSMAQGQYDALRGDFEHSAEPVADFSELAHRADLRLMLGDLNGATRWYRTAQDFANDVDPLPLAWLYTQQGIALLRAGDTAQAKRFFESAHTRLPQYVLATEHLAECEAELGNTQRARELYQGVIAQTDNPEFMAALARLEEDDGHAVAAASARQQAERGYRDLLARHRPAYAQHAAEFLLSIGKTEEALALARENLAIRADYASLSLLARAADAAGARSESCAAIARVRATGLNPPEAAAILALGHQCPQTLSAVRLQTPRFRLPG